MGVFVACDGLGVIPGTGGWGGRGLWRLARGGGRGGGCRGARAMLAGMRPIGETCCTIRESIVDG